MKDHTRRFPIVDPAQVQRAPAEWLRANLRIAPARVPIGHTLRSGIAVGAPFIIGSLTGHVLVGMWIGLATLLLAAGEREGTYRLNLTIIAVSTPVAAAGYLLGFAQNLSLFILIPIAAVVAFLAGAGAGLGPAFSVAGMQFLLVASIALGVPHINWWIPLGLYFVGAALYAALLTIEMLIDPRRPQRVVLIGLLDALAALASARSADLTEGGDRTSAARTNATSAYQNAVNRLTEISARPSWSTRVWLLDSDALTAADRVQALLLACTNPADADSAQGRLAALSARVAATSRPHHSHDSARPTDSGDATAHTSPDTSTSGNDPLLGALALLEESARPGGPAGSMAGGPTRSTRPAAPARSRSAFALPAISHEAVLAGCRLALCYAIAVGAREYFPFDHWFWVPLTVCLVMKPDFGSVFSRAVLRVIGTVAGAAVATAILLLVPKGWAIGLAIGLLSACVPYAMMRSYAFQAVAIAPAVLLLVDVIQPGDGSANYSIQRIGATVVGGLVVIVFGYLIWPRSRRTWIAGTFAESMTNIAEHLRLASSPVPEDAAAAQARHDELISARRVAYRGLTDLHYRLRRALAEPGVAGRTAAAWIPVVSAADRLADSVTAYAGGRLTGSIPAAAESGGLVAGAIAAAGASGADAQGTGVPESMASDPYLGEIVADLARVEAMLIPSDPHASPVRPG